MQTDCVILGGGAGGLCAAAALGRRRLHVTVVERLPRVGKKLLATGNGRCNLSNLDMKAAHYGKAAPFVEQMYAVTPPSEVAAFFSSLGLMTVVEDDRVYPRTMAASAVLDVLRMACERTSVTLLTDTEAVALTPSRRGGWSVQLADGSGLFAPRVIAAMGGSAAPSMGTDGTGARLMQSLGHEITPLYPALVQLKCIHPALKGLKGIRTQARLTLLIDGTPAAEEVGELLLTDYEVENLRKAYERTLAVGAASQKEMSQQDYELYGTYIPFSMAVCHTINHKSGMDHTTYAHTGASVNIYALGVGAEKFRGVFDNTEIYHKLAELTGVQ